MIYGNICGVRQEVEKYIEAAIMFENNNQNNTDEQLNNIEEQLTEIELLRKSVDEHKKSLKSFWKSFLVTGFIMIAAMIALLFGAMAWFVANNRTNAGSAEISANGGYTFSLATLKNDSQGGVYDVNQPEDANSLLVENSPLAKALNKFFRADKNGRDDDTGNHYTKFLDLPSLRVGTSVFTAADGKQYILGDSEGISLMVNGTSNVNNIQEFEHIGPGSYGEFTFYIIPHIQNFDRVTVSVSLQPFTLEREGDPSDKKATGKAKPVENNSNNEVLLNMLQGHILLFTSKGEDGNYDNRILPDIKDGTICFTFTKDSNTTTWVKNQPEPVTIYWIWPKRFENIKYCGQEGSVFKSSCQSYIELLEWINMNKTFLVNTTNNLENPMGNLTNQQFAQWSAGYNKGDQLIGDNIAFFQWVIDAE